MDSPYNHDINNPNEACRYDEGKPRIELVPGVLLEEAAKIFSFGAKKYNDWNWTKGFPWLQPYASAMRHLLAWYKGEDLDAESGLPHLAHAIVNLAMLLHYAKYNLGQDNRLNLKTGQPSKEV
jgi:hypothetical protein